MVGGAAFVTFENLYIRADPVFKYCYKWVANDSVVQSKLGDGLKAGNLRSYRLDAGKIEMVGKTPVWRAPRIQVCFKRELCGIWWGQLRSVYFPPILHKLLLMSSLKRMRMNTGDALY